MQVATDNRSYQFRYNSYGELARVVLPTGGAYEYDYTGGKYDGPSTGEIVIGEAQDNYPILQVYRRLIVRRIYLNSETGTYENITTYSRPSVFTQDLSQQHFVEVDVRDAGDNLLNRTRNYYYGNPVKSFQLNSFDNNPWRWGREFKTELLDTDGTTVLRRIENTWEQKAHWTWWTGPNAEGEPAYDPRITQTETTLVETNQVAKQTFTYDNFNNQTDVYEYDYGDSTQPKRRTHTDYVTDTNYTGYTGAHLRSLPLRTWVSSDALGNNKASFVEYEYDVYSGDSNHAALVQRTDATGFDSSYNVSCTVVTDPVCRRGNMTRAKTFANAANQTEPIETYAQYDVLGNTVKAIDAKALNTTIDYSDRFDSPDGEARGNWVTTSRLSQLSGLSTYAFPTSVTNPLGWTTYTQVDYFTGQAVDVEDVNGVVSSAFYEDLLDRPTKSISANNQPGFRHQTKILYNDDPTGLQARTVTTLSDLNNFDDKLLKTISHYDGLGRTIQTDKYEADGGYIAIESVPFTLIEDPETHIMRVASQVSNPYRPLKGDQPVYTTRLNDALGRIIKVITSDGAKVKTEYNGNATTVTDQALKQRRSIIDAFGRLVRVDEPNDAGQLDVGGSPIQPTTYTYDVLNNLTQVQQLGTTTQQCGGSTSNCTQIRTFVFDSLSRLKEATNPESGTSPTNGTIFFTYDNNGNIKTRRDVRGIKTVYDYDNLNRIINRCYRVVGSGPLGMTTCSGNTETVEPNTNDVAYTYDNLSNAKGNIIKVDNGFSKTEYTQFDILGRVTKSKQTTDGTSYGTEIEYTYNLGGALIEEKYPSGRIVKNILGNDGKLSIVQSKKNSNYGYWNYADNFTYTAAGAVSSMQLGNFRWESTQFNNRLQPYQIALGSTQAGTDLLKLNYDYGTTDNNGNIKSQQITVPTVGIHTGFLAVQTYTYDSLNRIHDAKENLDGNTIPQWKQTFSYDRFGNRNFDEANTTASPTFPKNCSGAMCAADKKIYNPAIDVSRNRLSPSDDYSFDNVGNMTKDAQGRKFTYDAENKQVKVETLNSSGTITGTVGEYFYDSDGNRVKKYVQSTGETTIYVYDGAGMLVAEYSTIVANQSEAKVNYLTSDPLGSSRINTDANGQIIARHDYQPFGEEVYRLNYGSDSVRKKFTSYERDNESNLDFAQARMYQNLHGRFTSPDVLGGNVSNPQTLNKYAYVLNNPVNLSDPSGYCGKTAGSPDETPCIWLYNKDLGYMSVSEKEYGDGSDPIYNGYSRVTDPDSVRLDNPTFTEDYASVPIYQYYQANHITVQLGADGMFHGVGLETNIGDEETPVESENDNPILFGGLNPIYNPLPWKNPLDLARPDWRGAQRPMFPTNQPGYKPSPTLPEIPAQPKWTPGTRTPWNPPQPAIDPANPTLPAGATWAMKMRLIAAKIGQGLSNYGFDSGKPPGTALTCVICNPAAVQTMMDRINGYNPLGDEIY